MLGCGAFIVSRALGCPQLKNSSRGSHPNPSGIICLDFYIYISILDVKRFFERLTFVILVYCMLMREYFKTYFHICLWTT